MAANVVSSVVVTRGRGQHRLLQRGPGLQQPTYVSTALRLFCYRASISSYYNLPLACGWIVLFFRPRTELECSVKYLCIEKEAESGCVSSWWLRLVTEILKWNWGCCAAVFGDAWWERFSSVLSRIVSYSVWCWLWSWAVPALLSTQCCISALVNWFKEL